MNIFCVDFKSIRLCAVLLLINASGCSDDVQDEKYKSTREAIMSTMAAIQLYRLDYGRYPGESEWQRQLRQTVDINSQDAKYKDQWGEDLQFEISGADSGCKITVYSVKKSDDGKIFLLHSKPCQTAVGK